MRVSLARVPGFRFSRQSVFMRCDIINIGYPLLQGGVYIVQDFAFLQAQRDLTSWARSTIEIALFRQHISE